VIFFDDHWLAGFVAQHLVGVRADRGLFGIGDAGEHADCAHGQFGAEVFDEVEVIAAHQRVEARDAERADLVFDGAHLLRCKGPRDDCAVDGVQWRVFVDEDSRRHDGVCHDDFEDVAFSGAELGRVFEGGVDVGVSADAPEVVALVVIDRGFVAKPAIGRVGIAIDADIPRVVIQVVAHVALLIADCTTI